MHYAMSFSLSPQTPVDTPLPASGWFHSPDQCVGAGARYVSQQKGPGFNPRQTEGLPVWSLHVSCVGFSPNALHSPTIQKNYQLPLDLSG